MFDREDVVKAIQPGDLMGGRIEAVTGSFFDALPSGADIYISIRVLHDWSDGDCLRILRGFRSVMTPSTVLLLGEQILEPDPTQGQATGYLVDMQMMAMFGLARERTGDEFQNLLAASGMLLHRIIPTGSPVSIIEATAAQAIHRESDAAPSGL